MAGFPLGVIALLAAAILIIFGLGQRVLDRLYLTDKSALIVIGAMIVGSFLNIPLKTGQIDLSINIGGGIIPVVLAVYVFFRAGTAKERLRTIAAVIVTALAVWGINNFVFSGDPWQTGTDFIDPLYIYPIIAGGIAYILGRSRRGAFVAATLGILLLDFYNYFYLFNKRIPGTVAIGGAGAFDIIVLSGLAAVLLAELVGETMERMRGGPDSSERPPELLKGLRKPEIKDVNSEVLNRRLGQQGGEDSEK